MSPPGYPVFIRRGDACAEVDRIAEHLKATQGCSDVGLHKCLYVARADQTVVMVTARDTPLAEALRARQGWEEPAPSL